MIVPSIEKLHYTFNKENGKGDEMAGIVPQMRQHLATITSAKHYRINQSHRLQLRELNRPYDKAR